MCYISMMSYSVYVTFYYSTTDSIADTYMFIEKRQVQPNGPELFLGVAME